MKISKNCNLLLFINFFQKNIIFIYNKRILTNNNECLHLSNCKRKKTNQLIQLFKKNISNILLKIIFSLKKYKNIKIKKKKKVRIINNNKLYNFCKIYK